MWPIITCNQDLGGLRPATYLDTTVYITARRTREGCTRFKPILGSPHTDRTITIWYRRWAVQLDGVGIQAQAPNLDQPS
jgi:hypothetical protein